MYSETSTVTDISSENKTQYERDKAASVKTPVTPTNISIIGAAQPVAYQLLPRLFKSCFQSSYLAITLQDVKDHVDALKGVSMELYDCSYPELHSVTVTHDIKSAVKSADYVVILDPLDSVTHENRFQLLKTANLLYRDVAASVKGALKPDAKVGLSGNYKAVVS